MNALSLAILGPALIAGLVVLSAQVPLGAILVRRGVVFAGIALAQAAMLGAGFGEMMWGEGAGWWWIQLSALAAALGCAVLLAWAEKNLHPVQESAAAVLYVVSAALQIVILSRDSHGSEHLRDVLIGHVLAITPTTLLVVGVLHAAAFAVWYLRDLERERLLFYGLLAVVITASVQVVGVLLVFASLLIPALATRQAPARWRLMAAYNLGAVSYFLGLVLSAVLDVLPAAAIICTLAVLAAATAKLIALLVRPAPAAPADVKAIRDQVQPGLSRAA